MRPAPCLPRPLPAAPALTVPVFAGAPITGNAPLKVDVTMPSAWRLAGMNRLEVDMSLGCPPPGRDVGEDTAWRRGGCGAWLLACTHHERAAAAGRISMCVCSVPRGCAL